MLWVGPVTLLLVAIVVGTRILVFRNEFLRIAEVYIRIRCHRTDGHERRIFRHALPTFLVRLLHFVRSCRESSERVVAERISNGCADNATALVLKANGPARESRLTRILYAVAVQVIEFHAAYLCALWRGLGVGGDVDLAAVIAS